MRLSCRHLGNGGRGSAKLAALAGVDITPALQYYPAFLWLQVQRAPRMPNWCLMPGYCPTPFYEESLRPFSGLDKPVAEYVFSFPQSSEFLRTTAAVYFVFRPPHYQKSGKTRLTVAIGCTGGQHRSVAHNMALAQYIRAAHRRTSI
ncbi:MAG: RNase adapter RapZ [Vampirovibrionales bacterium]